MRQMQAHRIIWCVSTCVQINRLHVSMFSMHTYVTILAAALAVHIATVTELLLCHTCVHQLLS